MQSPRLPRWLRTKLPAAVDLAEISRRTYAQGLSTVCKEARCPNQGECFHQGTATFLILGDKCTRDCSFCAVEHGQPAVPLPHETRLVADAVVSLQLKYVVVTSVTRDDLSDGGSAAFAATVEAIRCSSPRTAVEVLIPDFQGSVDALERVLRAGPDVVGHNLETVPRLYPVLRPAASYSRSVEILRRIRDKAPGIITKSGIMVGVGETRSEIHALIRDLVQTGCQILTIGQYLRPTKRHHSVARFIAPQEFEELAELARREGIPKVASGPLVRSSYQAREIFEELKEMAVRRWVGPLCPVEKG